jgi:hypothetical protein
MQGNRGKGLPRPTFTLIAEKRRRRSVALCISSSQGALHILLWLGRKGSAALNGNGLKSALTGVETGDWHGTRHGAPTSFD